RRVRVVPRRDKIAIVSTNRVEGAVAAYACFGLGVAFVPMYEAQLPKDWEFIVRDCDAKALVVATAGIADKTCESSPTPRQTRLVSSSRRSRRSSTSSRWTRRRRPRTR